MKTKISQTISFFLVVVMLVTSCVNLLVWDFFFLFKQYLVILFIICNAIIILLNYQKTIKQQRVLFFLGAITLLIYVFNSMFYDSFSIQEGGSGLLLVNLVLSFISFNAISFSVKQTKFILNMVGLFSIVYLLFHFFHYTPYNANTLGTFSFVLLIYVLLWLEFYSHRLVVKLIVFFVFFAFAYLQECRSVLIGELLFLMMLIFSFWINKIFFRVLVIGLNLGSIILPPLWVQIWLSGFTLKIPFIDKGLYSGRERVWNTFLNAFYDNPLIGSGNGVLQIPLEHYKEFTAHNFLLAVLTVYGILIFVLVFISLTKILYNKRDKIVAAKVSTLPLAGLLGILATSYFEIIPISYIHSIMIWFLLTLINSKIRAANMQRGIK